MDQSRVWIGSVRKPQGPQRNFQRRSRQLTMESDSSQLSPDRNPGLSARVMPPPAATIYCSMGG